MTVSTEWASVYIGETSVDRIYLGSDLVWSVGGPAGWSGNFITVGSGKDYSNLDDAVAASSSGDILLCYGEIESSSTPITSKVFIRGMNNCKITGYDVIDLGANSDVFIENVELIADGGNWGKCIVLENSNLIKLYANKCVLDAENANYDWCLCVGSKSSTGVSQYFSNCDFYHDFATLSRYAHHQYIFLNYISLVKCYCPDYSTYAIVGSLNVSDFCQNPTSGYGSNYGSLIITDAFLASHGY